MARSIEDIQRDIDRTRRQLASTLDEIAGRANPSNLAGEVRTELGDRLRDPKVLAVVGGVAAVIIGAVALSLRRSRSRDRELQRIKELLEFDRS